MLEVKNIPVCDAGATEKCLFCAIPLPPTFTVVNGVITRLKKETADRDDEDDCLPSTSCTFLSTENPLLDKQLEVVFILKNILHIPEKKLHHFLKQFGGQLQPEFWCQVCSLCAEPVRQFFETLKEISELKKRLNRISKQLKGRIYNTKDVGGAEEGFTCIWEEIRGEVLKDFQTKVPEKDSEAHQQKEDTKHPKYIKSEVVPPSQCSSADFQPDEEDNNNDDDDKSSSDFVPEEDSPNFGNHSDSEGEEYKPSKAPSAKKHSRKRKPNAKSSPKKKKSRPPTDEPYRSLYTVTREGSASFYKCNLCSAVRSMKERIIKHLRIHENGEGEICSICQWLVHPGRMNHHKSFYHPETFPKVEKKRYYFYTCKKCPARYAEMSWLQRHVQLHDPSNTEPCSICHLCGWLIATKRLKNHLSSPRHNRRWVENQEKRSEIREITTEIPYYCDHCPMIFTMSNNLIQHFEFHHVNTQDYVACEQPDCGEKFVSKQLLKFHLDKAHNITDTETREGQEEVDQKCPHCELVFNSKMKVDYHLAKKHKHVLLTCTTCNVTFKYCCDYQKHMEETRAHATSATYSCEFCGKSYWSEEPFKNHRRKEHFKELGLEPFKCNECQLILASKQTLKEHVQSVHLHEKCICQLCGKAFSSRKRLYLHVRTHKAAKETTVLPEGNHFRLEKGEDGGETWFCEFCPLMIFPNRVKVCKHLQSEHYQELKYVCDGCGKRFCASMGLHQHRFRCEELVKKTGVVETPTFECSFCPKKFFNSDGKYKHQKKVHKDRYSHMCQKCGHLFSGLKTLEEHQQTCEN